MIETQSKLFPPGTEFDPVFVLIVALAGGALGVFFAWWGTRGE